MYPRPDLLLCDNILLLVESCLRTIRASISGSHFGQGKAEARGVIERRRVVTCDGFMMGF